MMVQPRQRAPVTYKRRGDSAATAALCEQRGSKTF